MSRLWRAGGSYPPRRVAPDTGTAIVIREFLLASLVSGVVTPVLALGRSVGLASVLLRFGPDAILRLLAGTMAILTRDDKRAKRCLKVLRLARRNSPRRWRSRGPR